MWADLAAEDAAKAYRAVWTLAVSTGQAIELLEGRLRPTPVRDPKRVARLIADLDSDEFETREAAMKELAKAGPGAAPALRKALAGSPSAEVRDRISQLLKRLGAGGLSADRLRANLDRLPPTSAAYKRYLEKFDTQETEIEKLQAEIKKQQDAEKAQQKEYEDYLAGLSVE